MSRYTLPALVLLGMVLRFAYALAIYEPTFLPYFLDDYELYRLGAVDIRSGDLAFTNSLYLLRPPLYPLLVAVLGMQPFLVIAVNVLLATAMIPLTYHLAHQFQRSNTFALLAAGVVAIDITSIKYSSAMIPEPLANLLLAFGFVSMLKLRNASTNLSVIRWGLLSGALIALSALTRPAAYLLWIPMSIWVLLSRIDKLMLAAGLLALAGFLGTGTWMLHNSVTFQNSSFSTVGNWNMLYCRAASVLHQATGKAIEDVYAELAGRVEAGLGNETVDISAQRRHHHYGGGQELQSTMTSVALSVFLEHPLVYVLTIPVGLYRILLQVSGVLLLPGIVWNAVFLLFASLGLWNMREQGHWNEAVFLLLLCAYFAVGTLIVTTSCVDTRARVMVTPLLAVMAAYGIQFILNRRRAASASPSPPA